MARIVLVEDELLVRDTLIKVLQRAGHRIETFANMQDTLAECDFASVDLIVTDLIMGVRNQHTTEGEELIEILRREYPQLPILVVTGDVTERVDRVKSLGVGRVLYKPFEPVDLVKAVAELI